MGAVLLVCRLALAAVFFVAGAAKLADRRGSRKALIGFGVPASLAGPLGVALPVAEICVAGALVPESTAWWGATGALVLLLAFVAALSVSLVRGQAPDCHCFGQLHSSPAGRSTLLRNMILAAAAALVVAQGPNGAGPSAVGWVSGLDARTWVVLGGILLAVAVLAALSSALVSVLRQNGRLIARIEAIEEALGRSGPPAPNGGLAVGTPAPSFDLPDLNGSATRLEELLLPTKPLVAVFTEAGCVPCAELMPHINDWKSEYEEKLVVAVVGRKDVRDQYGIPGTPAAVLIDPSGRIASEPALGADEIELLVTQVAKNGAAAGNGAHNGRFEVPWGAKRGDPAPDFRLPDLSGAFYELADLRGLDTLLLFWDPGCSFCGEMLEDLKDWETSPPPGAPKLVVVSVGGPDVNRAQGFYSLVLLDESSSTRRPFGIPGTPSAVLLDADNVIASDVAAGADEVLALARARENAFATS